MKIYLGADHRGFTLKEKLKKWIEKHDISHEDLGAPSLDLNDDYTLYAEKVASVVADENNARGVLLCGSGVGVDVVANKFDGVRASIGKNEAQVKAGRADDDMNILVIAADYTNEADATKMLRAFLDTDFSSNERHKRRLDEISRIEQNN